MRDFEQLHLLTSAGNRRGAPLSPAAVVEAFDVARLTQARHLAGLTKAKLAKELGVTPAAVSQYEMGTSRPRPDLIPRLAEVLGIPISFFLAGRPNGNLDASMAHFRSLRSTRAYQRAKAVALVEQAWELTYALERKIDLPWVDLPGFTGAEVESGTALPRDPVAAAAALREYWGLGPGPVTHLVRRLEQHGIVVITPQPDPDAETVDAFSTSHLPRPIMVITPNRSNDIYRHRFTAAHELGHLVLHGDTAPGDSQQEREADTFAAEFLTPRASILPLLPTRVDLAHLAGLQRAWGVSVKSLLYRCRELGLLSDSAAGRAYQRLHTLGDQPGFRDEPVTGYPGEQPLMLAQAFELASRSGLTVADIADELAWPVPRVRELLGFHHPRTVLTLVEGASD